VVSGERAGLMESIAVLVNQEARASGSM
jgi:hypothetical protein